MKRYVICYPQGGWNDILSRIWYCHQSCVRTDRWLIVDTRKCWFQDDLSEYITLSLPRLLHFATIDDLDAFVTRLYAEETVFPPELAGTDNRRFPPIVWNPHTVRMETESGVNLAPELCPPEPFTETVVINANCGTSNHVNDVLRGATLAPAVLDRVKRRWDQLPKPFFSVHIRNTDRTTPHIQDFIEGCRSVLSHVPVFIASDDINVIRQFQDAFGSHAYTFTATLPTLPPGKSAHESPEALAQRTGHTQIREFNLDILADFFLLATGNEYLATCQESGFSRSIFYLRQEPELLRRLLPFVL